jgi:hypothetical protein
VHIVDWLVTEGLWLSRLILINLIWIGALFVGVQSAQRWNKLVGWSLGLFSLVVLSILLFPAADAIKEKACRTDTLAEDCY